MPAFARSPHGLTDEELKEKERRERLARERAEAEALAAANVDTFVELQEPTPPVTRKPRPVATVREYVPVDKPVAQATADPVTTQPATADTVLTQPGSKGGSKRMPSTPSFISGARNIDTSPLNFTPETFADLPEDLASRGVPVEAFEIAAMESQKSQAMHDRTPLEKMRGMPLAQQYAMMSPSRVRGALEPGGVPLAESHAGEFDLPGAIREGRIGAASLGHGAYLGAKLGMGQFYQNFPGAYKGYGSEMERNALRDIKKKAHLAEVFAEYGGPGFNPEGNPGGKLSWLKNSMIQSAVSSLPLTLGTISASIAGGLPVGLGAMFATVASDSYGEKIGEGMSKALAAEYAIVNGGFEVLTELPFLRVLKSNPAAKKALQGQLSKILKGSQAEGGGEAVNTILMSTYEIIRHNKDMTPEQVMTQAVDSYILGVLMGAGISTPITVAQSAVMQHEAKTSKKWAGIQQELVTAGNRDIETGEIINKSEGLVKVENELIEHIQNKYPDIEIIDGVLQDSEKSPGTLEVGEFKDGKVRLYIDGIITLAKNPAEAKKIADIGARHEKGHELLINESEIRDNFFNNNRESILEWLGDTPAYDHLAGQYAAATKAAQENPMMEADALEYQRLVTEEFINNTGESDIKLTSPVRLAVLEFAQNMGANVSAETNARLVLKNLIAGNVDKLRAQAKSGGLQSKSRREFMQKAGIAGAGVAVNPAMILEPGVQPDAVSPPVDAFAGGIMRPGVAPEMEGVLRAAAADAAPAGSLVTPQASEAFDDFDFDVARQEDIDREARIKEVDEQLAEEERQAKEDAGVIPQKWRELDTEDLQTLAEANRAKDNPIWQAQFKELESRKATDEAAATEVEEFETIGLEEARLETQKQIDTFNQQLDDFEASVDESWGGRFSKKLSKTRRDTNDDWQKRFQPNLEGQELEVGKLVHRLNNATHMKGRASIGLEAEPLDRAGFRTIMTDLMNGETESAIAFVDEQRAIAEQYTKAKKASAKEAAAERYAQRVGKDRSAVAPRRAKGTVSELEGIMTPALAKKEIDAQLEAGDIDQAAYDTKLERIKEIQKTVKGSGTSTQQKRKLLTEVAIGTEKIGRVPLDEMEREGFIGKREPNIPVEETKAPRSKAEIAKDNQAAYEKARAAGKVEVIPPKEGVAEEAKAAFDKGVTKKSTDSSWNLPSESMFESRDYDSSEFTTEQGEQLGEGYGEALERKSIKMKVPSRKGSIEIIPSETGVKYIQKIPGQADQEVTSSEASFNEKKDSGYFADYAVSYRVSKGFKNAFKNPESALYKWAKSNPEYDEGEYWPTDDSVLVSEWVKGFAKPGGYQLLEEAAAADGVTVPNELSRAEGDRMSPTDPLVNRAIARAKDLNAEYEPVFGKNTFAPDHVVEMLGYKIFGDGTRSFPRGVNTANNVATIPKIVHDAINDWPKAATTPAERVRRKNSPNKIRDMLNDPDFLNSKDKYKGVAKFLRDAKGVSKAVDKYGKPDPVAQEVILLNATADLLGIKNDLASRPWNAETFTGTLTRESEGIAQATQDAFGRFSRKLKNDDPADTQKITADFTSNTLRTLAQYVFGAPVKRITDFNKLSALSVGEQGNIPMATTIGNLIQRSLSSQARPEGMEQGTDLVQETSLRTGEFYSRLFKVFAGVTNNGGLIPPAVNAQIVDYIAGKPVEFASKETEAAAKELKTFMEDMYKYAKGRTAGLKTPLDLRGAGDSVLPRVWNIDYIATRGGKRKFLEAVANKFTDPEGKLVFEEANITPEDLYAVVVNSGGFVQGEWTNIKADQTTSKKEIEKDQLIQEYLDSLSTEELADAGLLVDDLQSVIPRFVQKSVERAEYSAVFGVNDELLRGMVQTGVDQIKAHNEAVMKMDEGGPNNLIDDKAFQKAVWDMSKILRNKFGYDMADMPTRKWLQRIANVEVVAKLPLVTLASLPEFFTPMLKGDVRPDKFATDFVMASAWAGYKGMNGLSKLLFNKHLPAMLKHSSEIEGLGIISDIQLLREMGIADIQAMGDSVATRYSNPNFARGGIRATTKGTVGGKIPKPVRAVFNMQTYMQATMLTTLTEMQQFMALRNYQRHVSTRIKAINESKGKKLKGKRAANRLKQYKQDLLDYGLTEDVDLSTPQGEAAFNAGALRFIDQVITRPNDATTAKIFKNPLTAPLVLFKRFITTYGNTLLTSVGTDFATKIDNVERAKQVGKLTVAAASMYGAVIFADILRGAIKGDLDDEDFNIKPEDWKTFLRRIDRMGVLSAPGSAAANLTFPSKAWYGDTGTNRMVRELTGPFGSDMAGTLDFIMSKKGEKDLRRLIGQVAPISRSVLPKQERKKKKTTKSLRDKKRESKQAYAY